MPIKRFLLFFLLCNLLVSCSLTKYVPEDKTLLSRVKIKKDTPELDASSLNNYVLQQPNSYMIGFMRTKLATYGLSGNDTTKWINRTLRKLGEEPVIFDSSLAEMSQNAINQAVKNKGFLNSKVTFEVENTGKRKRQTNVTYRVFSGTPFKIGRYEIDIKDDTIKNIINRFSNRNPLEDKLFDVDLLDDNRRRIAQNLRRLGYYNVQKEHFSYTADTSLVRNYVDLKLVLQKQYINDSIAKLLFTKKKINKISIHCYSENRIFEKDYLTNLDTVYYNDYQIIYNQKKHIFKPKFLATKIMLSSNQTYNERMVERTNSNFGNLMAIKNVNVDFLERDSDMLDCRVFVSPSDRYGYSVGVDGTTTSNGDLGAKLNLGFADKNIFKGAEIFRLGANTSYEARREPYAYVNDNDTVTKNRWLHSYSIGGEASLTIPQILLPFITNDFRRRYGGSTVFSVNYLYQNIIDRYKRSIANASMSYYWQRRNSKFSFSLVDLSYVYVPYIDEKFKGRLTPLSRYSFEDHLIMRMGFGWINTNMRNDVSMQNFYTFRTSLKLAGNLFYTISKLTNQKKDDGIYKIFKTPYSQFVKGEFDYSYNYSVNKKTKIVFHAGFGIGVPYGNASVLPYEERFYSGGANSLRGWNARSLGPGAYNSSYDIFNQTGDIKLELNLEARFKLFWVLEGAFFIDAGNIWTIKNYPEQAGGVFLFTKKNVEKYNAINLEHLQQIAGDNPVVAPNSCAPFYEQIACSYGIGIRADFSFFLLRFDLGFKLFDPKYQSNGERWRTNLSKNNDIGFNFAIGYPF